MRKRCVLCNANILRFSGVSSLCEHHLDDILSKIRGEDRELALRIMNNIGKEVNPIAKIFLDSLPDIVEGIKKTEAHYLEIERNTKEFIEELNTLIAIRTQKEEKIQAKLRELKQTPEPIPTKRTKGTITGIKPSDLLNQVTMEKRHDKQGIRQAFPGYPQETTHSQGVGGGNENTEETSRHRRSPRKRRTYRKRK